MPEQITADQFEIHATPWVPGRQVLQNFDFDERKCVIEVEEGGCLSITQEGKNNTFSAGPGYWRRVTVEVKKTSADALQEWRDAYKYLGDGDSGVTPARVYLAANNLLHLVEIENKTLADLVPDEAERREIEEHIGKYQESLMEC